LQSVKSQTVREKTVLSESDEILQPLLKPQVKSLLLKGEPGTGKTTLALELLRIYGKGIYVSTRLSQEQSKEHHPALNSLFEKGDAIELSAQDYDLKHGSSSVYSFNDLRFSNAEDVVNAIIRSIQKIKKPMIILDSWDAIGNRTEKNERLKVEQSLALIALGNDAKLLFVSEEPNLTTTDYLVDAVVTLRNELYDGRRIRKIQWNKIRGSAMANWSNLFTLYDGRFTVFSMQAPMWQSVMKPQPFVPTPHKDPYYSTGSIDLDEFHGGGLRKTFFILVEFGKYVGSAAFNPISTSIRCNFIMNDGCSLTIPSPGVSANRIKDSMARHVPMKQIDSSLRLAYFELFDDDPCFFALDASSTKESFDRIMKEAEKIKGEKNRPCVFSLGSETLEYVFAREDAFRFVQGMVQRVRHFGDVLYAVTRYASPLSDELSNLSDIHIKIDQIDGTIVMQRLKPWSPLYAVIYDYSKGYPNIKLAPFV
jgi:KaiC/GvpD/RAD55 family RecA-like ATPase